MTLHKRDISFILNDGFSLSRDLQQLFFCYLFLDCEQSLFFFWFSKRAISLAPSVTRHQSRAISHALSVSRVAICVSRVLLDRLQKKERLLVV